MGYVLFPVPRLQSKSRVRFKSTRQGSEFTRRKLIRASDQGQKVILFRRQTCPNRKTVFTKCFSNMRESMQQLPLL